jgi:predicted ATPase/class 3 adenylate cyclase
VVGEGLPGDAGAGSAVLAAGSRIAGYVLEEEVGAGGMAVVFRARDERLGRLVALKVLTPGLVGNEEFRRRFLRESRAAAAVDDPHIIPVYEAGEAGGVLFISMRYVSGGDVRGLLRREGPLPPARVAAVISPVACALDAAHGAGLVHRDVKPGNMLIDARPGRPDHVYLSDFGLARSGSASALTRTGLYLGTVAYMAPEQIQGGVVDGRADQYALGCAAFELLCGAVPFERDQDMAVLYAHLSVPPPSAAARCPEMPARVDEVLARALAKAPGDRYASCGEFAEALRGALGLPGYDRDAGAAAAGAAAGRAGPLATAAPGATVIRPAAGGGDGAARELPAGTITMLFSDIEGSTMLLSRLGEAYGEALSAQRAILRAAIADSGGHEMGTEGDSFFVVFGSAADAVACCVAAQRALADHRWPGGVAVRVRMGLHSGEPVRHQDSYVGLDVHRAARIAAAAHGGQVVLSDATWLMAQSGLPAGVSVRDLGLHRLKDLPAPERIYQLAAPGLAEQFPPLKSLGAATSLPVPATALVGRKDDVERLRAVLARPGTRLVTLTGTGGIGKTRLAVHAAGGLPDEFPDGLWWVGLAPVSRGELVLGTLAQVLGVREDEGTDLERAVAARLDGRRMLIVLDNAEHLLPELADVVVRLLAASDRLVVLATSRERLQLSAEHVYPVHPLPAADAVALLQERAAAAGVPVEQSPVLGRLCERLDRMPLALELAAARLRLFSPAQLLDRIDSRLDLFAGPRDAEPRHRTLRATIEWSHDLLAEPEQALFRRLAVFAADCTLDAAESVCQPEPGALEGLLDKSLVVRGDDGSEPRFGMLESIRDFAAERLAAAGEETELRARQAGYFRALAERMDAALRAGEPEEGPVAVLAADIGNLRAAVEFGLQAGDAEVVRQITAALDMYWDIGGLYTEARSWLDRALALSDVQDVTRQRLLSALAGTARTQGDYMAAQAASDEAASLAMALAGEMELFESLLARFRSARSKDDLRTAEAVLTEALGVALAAGNGVGTSACRLGLVSMANRQGRHEEADDLLAENLPFVRGLGQIRCEGYTLANMADTSIRRGRLPDCAAPALLGATRALQIGDKSLAAWSLDLFAVAAAAAGDQRRAAAILAAVDTARHAMGIEPDADEQALRQQALKLVDPHGQDFALGQAEGQALDLPAALSLAASADLTPA